MATEVTISNASAALCPWHGEETPSLVLDRKAGTFRCLGCGCEGRIIGPGHTDGTLLLEPDEKHGASKVTIVAIDNPEGTGIHMHLAFDPPLKDANTPLTPAQHAASLMLEALDAVMNRVKCVASNGQERIEL